MKQILIALCCLLFFSSTASARCTGFNEEAAFLKKTADAICDVIPGTNVIKVATCGSIDTATNLAKDVSGWWNEIANNGPAKIGPRTLTLGINDHGKLIVPAGRLWIVDKPLAGEKEVTITYRGGKAGAMVDICKVDANGNTSFLGYVDIPKKSKKTGRKTVAIKDGGWLLVDMRAQGGPLKSYSYDIVVNNTTTSSASNNENNGSTKTPQKKQAPLRRTH